MFSEDEKDMQVTLISFVIIYDKLVAAPLEYTKGERRNIKTLYHTKIFMST